ASSIPTATPALLPSAIPAPTAHSHHTGSATPADRRDAPAGSLHTAGLPPPSEPQTTSHPTTDGACGKPADGLHSPNALTEFASTALAPDRRAAVAPPLRSVRLPPRLRSAPACLNPPTAAATLRLPPPPAPAVRRAPAAWFAIFHAAALLPQS